MPIFTSVGTVREGRSRTVWSSGWTTWARSTVPDIWASTTMAQIPPIVKGWGVYCGYYFPEERC